MKRFVIRRLEWVAIVLTCISGCGGGGNGGDVAGGQNNPLWASIDPQNLQTVVAQDHVDLSGQAYCDSCPPSEVAFGYCPDIKLPQSSAINVTWRNRTTGATGDTMHGITGSCSCLLSYCITSYSHKWSAYGVPLGVGSNVIEIMAHAGGNSSSSNPVTITRTPAMPEGLVAAPGQADATLQWNSVADATSYNLYWSTSATPTRNTALRIEGVTSPFVHTGLDSDTTYYYFVTAVNGSYESPQSQVVFATPGWHSEVVSATAGTIEQRDTSIAVDSAGHAHLHYSVSERIGTSSITSNYYMTNLNGAWTSEGLGNPLWVDAEIAVDSDDTVHVSYIDFLGVTHAVQADGAWTAEVIDARGWCDSSLAVDSGKNGHLAYYAISPTAGELWYATNVSGTWIKGMVGTFPQDIGCSGQLGTLSLAVEAAGTAHIAYAGKYPDYGLIYATKQSAGWVTQTVDTGYIPILSVAVDGNGNGHLAYIDIAGNLKHAHQDASGTWTSVIVDSGASSPSLALDAAGAAHLSYAAHNRLKYATNTTGSWRAIIVGNDAYADTALALDSQAKVHIGYFSGGNLKYVTNR